jgi:hypothetical protein|tara:strand:- start:21 stop:170 length:150 start_codon:yes stop_codon:yes gene_type:complete
MADQRFIEPIGVGDPKEQHVKGAKRSELDYIEKLAKKDGFKFVDETEKA